MSNGPTVEDLLERVLKLEDQVRRLQQHEHHVRLPATHGMVDHKTTKPLTYGTQR